MTKKMDIAILGNGLSAMSTAYFLKQNGISCIVYSDKNELATGGSGNNWGLCNPRLSAFYTSEGEFYKKSFELGVGVFPTLRHIGWQKCGALHFMLDDKKERRYMKTFQNWPHSDSKRGDDESLIQMEVLDQAAASDVAGCEMHCNALYLPDSGFLSPKKLCHAYSEGIEVVYNKTWPNLDDIDADAVILACGLGANTYTEASDLPLRPVRGQVTHIKATDKSEAVRTALCYGGYTIPAVNGVHTVGSTFQRWLDHSDILPEDDTDNINKLCEAVLSLKNDYDIVGNWAGVRVTAPDHFPIIGQLTDRVYISTAHGSHGILSSLYGAHILTSMLLGEALPASEHVIERLSPHRFQ